MRYTGQLYGKVAGKYFPLEATSEDVIILGSKMTPQQLADLLNCHVAMDKDGYWWWHMLKPQMVDDICWVTDSGWDEHESCGLVVPDLIDWEGDWKESLHSPIQGKVACSKGSRT